MISFSHSRHVYIIKVEVRELPLDVFGGPARGSLQFIVTKRACASQFDAATTAANRASKMEWAASAFSQTGSSELNFQAAKKWKKPRRLPPTILTTLRRKSVVSSDGRAAGIRRAVCGTPDCAALVGEKRSLAARSRHHRSGSNRVAEHIAGRIGRHGHVCESVTALDPAREHRVNQIGGRRSRCRPARPRSHIGKGVRKSAIAVRIQEGAFR